MKKTLTKVSTPNRQEVKQIQTLADHCSSKDQLRNKFYWNVISNRRTSAFDDILYYVDGNLIGYLGMFVFDPMEAEINAIVHPNFRHRGIFHQLLREAVLELQTRHINTCVFLCNRDSQAAQSFIQQFEPTLTYSVCHMQVVTDIPREDRVDIQFRLCGPEDVPAIASMDVDFFNASFERKLSLHFENMKDKNRKAWMVSINGVDVGKIHVRYDGQNKAFFHDLGILKEHRGKKYAKAMMLKTIDMMYKEGCKHISLDVMSDNISAIKLYERVGFDTVAIYDFLRVNLSSLAKL